MSGSSIKQYLENHKTEIVLGVLFFSFILGWNIINSAMSGIIINDGGWHIRLGEEILKQKHVNIAPYAWHANLKTTHNHEWLYDVIIYLLSGGNLSKIDESTTPEKLLQRSNVDESPDYFIF